MLQQFKPRHLIAVVALCAAFGSGVAIAREQQPEMRSALRHMREARKDLDRATRDKGGHRAKAMDLLDQAIREVEEGVRFDNKH